MKENDFSNNLRFNSCVDYDETELFVEFLSALNQDTPDNLGGTFPPTVCGSFENMRSRSLGLIR